MTVTTMNTTEAQQDYLLQLGDSALILGQRISEWCGHAPALEEDIALANIALDLIGQARLLLSYAGELSTPAQTEDDLAFIRTELAFRNLTMCELPNEDFARTILRNFLFTQWQLFAWESLLNSSDRKLAAIAEKSLKESRYHVQHSADWVIRLGDGTEESHRRMQKAVNYLAPYLSELFQATPSEQAMAAAGIAPLAETFQEKWQHAVQAVLHEATLTLPAESAFSATGKLGRHSEHLGHLLCEMQYMQRAYPGMEW